MFHQWHSIMGSRVQSVYTIRIAAEHQQPLLITRPIRSSQASFTEFLRRASKAGHVYQPLILLVDRICDSVAGRVDYRISLQERRVRNRRFFPARQVLRPDVQPSRMIGSKSKKPAIGGKGSMLPKSRSLRNPLQGAGRPAPVQIEGQQPDVGAGFRFRECRNATGRSGWIQLTPRSCRQFSDRATHFAGLRRYPKLP